MKGKNGSTKTKDAPKKRKATEASSTPPEYNLGERLKFLRSIRNLSQGQLAQAAGVAQSTIAQVETGRKDPSVSTLRKIAQALDTEVATLFAADQIYVFDLVRLRRKYRTADELTPHLYTALGRVVEYARSIGFIK